MICTKLDKSEEINPGSRINWQLCPGLESLEDKLATFLGGWEGGGGGGKRIQPLAIDL